MSATITGRPVSDAEARILRRAYRGLVKAGNDSVRAAWRFGQTLDSLTDNHTQLQLADAMGLSVSTIARYLRLYRAYQRVEQALEASAQLETYNIDTITELQNMLHPVEHGRPLAGRHWLSVCRTCHGVDIARVEISEDGQPVEDEDEDELAISTS
jgi:transcriptional regulator with XRE-family HTH domain